jgi:predicted transcriptional regulator
VASLTVSEKFMALLLLNKKGKLDRNLLISFESEAIEWGKELFMYYRELSRKIPREETDSMIFEKIPTWKKF